MANRSYAAGTNVDTGRSKAEIERTLERFGATGFMFGRDDEKNVFVVAFRREGRSYRFVLPMPDPETYRYQKSRSRYSRRGPERTASAINESVSQETRRRFRSLSNFVKATLDAIDTGILDFDTAMLPHLVLSDGRTVSQTIIPQVAGALEGSDLHLSLALPSGD